MRKLLVKLGLLKPKGYFKIKPSNCWFSREYVSIKYTTNGMLWGYLAECRESYISNQFVADIMYVPISSFDYYVERYKSIEDVIKHNFEVSIEVKKQNQAISDNYKRKKLERKKLFKKYK